MQFHEGELGALVVTFVRAAALVATAPVVGDSGVPMRARLVFVIALTLAIGTNRDPLPLAELPLTALVELAVGLVTGMSARFVMARVANAGQLIGLSLGLGFASEYDAHAGESAGTVRMLATTIASLAFIQVGGFEAIARGVAGRPAHLTELAYLGPQLIEHGTAAFGHGLALAAPVVIAALVGNLGLALMNRAAPAVNVFSVSLPAVLMIGGLVLVASAPSFIAHVVSVARTAAAILR
ncbi:MAG: flagellar biosynthetic protein FliR [Proteobacteria bacterium]|nr:flagellar biosynthetic protein FliR [Pseudomonadota bacterium]